jgi:hypothetical protein
MVYNNGVETEKRITVRLPADLHEILLALAKDQERSLNGQIVFLLRQATSSPKPQSEG